jgi:hypothetical protein
MPAGGKYRCVGLGDERGDEQAVAERDSRAEPDLTLAQH